MSKNNSEPESGTLDDPSQSSDGARGSEDPIASAIRGAGARSPLPQLDLEALGAPALVAWQERVAAKNELRRRGRRRRWALAASVILVAAAALFWNWRGIGFGGAPIAVVTASFDHDLVVGAPLTTGSVLETGGQPDTGLAVEMAAGHRIRLDSGTRLRLSSPRRLDLLVGAIYVEAATGPLQIHAGETVSEHIGTRYEVRLEDGEPVIRVREGQVLVAAGDEIAQLEAGELARRTPEEEWAVEATPIYGDSWRWIHRAAPPFDSDGASLESFLAWVEAESGWQIEIDPEVLHDGRGRPILVRGSIEGMDFEQALNTLLESAGLRFELVDGRLIVKELSP